jgi:hypothetical protein
MSNKIAMTPDQLPQQRIHAVVDLPPRPKSFESHCGKYLSIWGFPLGNFLKEKHSLGTVEWAWGPMHSRVDAYYLSTDRKRSHWCLWVCCFDGYSCQWESENTLYAYCENKGIPKKTAAIHLLIDAWNYERKFMELDHFHILNAVELLSVAELMAIGRVVWPEDEKALSA